MERAGRVERLSATDAVVKLRFRRTAIDLVAYAYPPLEKPEAGGRACFPVAGLLDLATMKLAAISTRPKRRT